MPTNYSSYESFLRTASGPEKDALSLYQGMDDLTGSELLEREDEALHGAAIHARLNAGYAGMTEAELLEEAIESIDAALEAEVETDE